MLVLGDSIPVQNTTEGCWISWPTLLERKAEQTSGVDDLPLSVVNHAQGGYNSGDLIDGSIGATNWAEKVSSVDFELVAFWFGANDHAIDPGETLPRVSEASYEYYIGQIIDKLKLETNPSPFNDGKPRILCMSPPYVYNSGGMDAPRLYRYAQIARRVASLKVVFFLDTYLIMAAACGWNQELYKQAFLFPDSPVHLHTRGHAVLMPHIEAKLRQMIYE